MTVKSYNIDKENADWLISQGKGLDRSASWYLNDLLSRCRAKLESKEQPKTKAPSKRFTPPTLDEAASYFRERGCPLESEVEKFMDFYESKGWMVGKNKMKDWKAAIRNWMKDKSYKVSQPPKLSPNAALKQKMVNFNYDFE